MNPRIVARTAVLVAVLGCVILSPLTALFVAAIVIAAILLTRGLDRDERRTVLAIVAIAIVLRALALAVLFLATDHSRVPFGTLFGDEEYYILRSLWLRNVALGAPMHPFDLEYAFEPNGSSSFLYVLAFLQVLVGPSPYGLHWVAIFCYVVAAFVLYRVTRKSLGQTPALLGLIVMLFLPSLFVWSIAVLKDAPFVLVSACSVALGALVARGRSWRDRLLAAAGVAALAAVQGTIRPNGTGFTIAAVTLGLVVGFVATRPRLIAALAIATPIACGAVLRMPDIQLRAYAAVQRLARQHWGAVVVSRGVGYHLLDERFYDDVNTASSMELGETVRFLSRGIVSYVTVPRPWDAQSRAAVLFIPEQVMWYALAALVPFGVILGFRKDPVVTGLLAAHAILIAAGAAFTDGNVGTLVRHRGLALPYLVWLSALGLCAFWTPADASRRQFETRSL